MNKITLGKDIKQKDTKIGGDVYEREDLIIKVGL